MGEHKIIKRRRLKKVTGSVVAPLRALSARCHASPLGRPIEGAERQPSSAMFTKTLCMKWLKTSKRIRVIEIEAPYSRKVNEVIWKRNQSMKESECRKVNQSASFCPAPRLGALRGA
ncbi:hypothetical protein LR48_Vigan02g091500 [Vigna angularis]|uniref:Uncharacterized protein n=1 Tax=Phaseolus angularis TaxID=3914 RepID=A0A0L9TW38_PHAAN|nr:hypothetical protein LR48_Vigan02g091500 [Vigna angularis]